MKNSDPIIVARGLGKAFRLRGNHHLITGLFKPQWQSKDAVLGVNFTIKKGETVAFLGPNGAGKTTTTKMLTGLIFPSSGSLQVLGYTPFDRNYDFLRRIGLVMGNRSGLNWDLTAAQSFGLLQKIYSVEPRACAKRIDELSELLQVQSVLHTQVRKLSLGERMKLELIAAILHDPEILFLDEPTIGLDIAAKKSVRRFLRTIHGEGKTLLLTSHDMDDVAAVCNRAIVINHGQIIYDQSLKKLRSQYTDVRYATLEFSGRAPSKDELSEYGNVLHSSGSKATVGLSKDTVMLTANAIAKKYPIADIIIEQVPLEVIISDIYDSKKVAT